MGKNNKDEICIPNMNNKIYENTETLFYVIRNIIELPPIALKKL